jgi:hypothetical protein
MSSHTPGPWMADTVDGFTTINVDNRGQTGQTITHMFDRHAPFKNAASNAKLIAAAPELLEAVRELLNCIDPARDWNEAKKARAALAKAGVQS